MNENLYCPYCNERCIHCQCRESALSDVAGEMLVNKLTLAQAIEKVEMSEWYNFTQSDVDQRYIDCDYHGSPLPY